MEGISTATYICWILTWRTPFTCRIKFIGGILVGSRTLETKITGYAPSSLSKPDARVFPAEMPRKLRRWYARRSCVQVERVRSRLEEMWQRELLWAFWILYNHGNFNPKSWKAEKFHRRSPSCPFDPSFAHFYTSWRFGW